MIVGLFGKPKALKNLQTELLAALVACDMSARLTPEHQQRIATTAPAEVAQAARKAAAAGLAVEARAMLEEKRQNPPKACPPGLSWEDIIQSGIDATT